MLSVLFNDINNLTSKYCIVKYLICTFHLNKAFYNRNIIMSNQANAEKRPGKDQGAGDGKEKRRKESILDLSKYLEKSIRVKFGGGREAAGILKGYDPLLNLVLDNTTEFLRDPDEPYKLVEDTRTLGLVVCRGTSVVLICPQDGMEAIQNPFISQDG